MLDRGEICIPEEARCRDREHEGTTCPTDICLFCIMLALLIPVFNFDDHQPVPAWEWPEDFHVLEILGCVKVEISRPQVELQNLCRFEDKQNSDESDQFGKIFSDRLSSDRMGSIRRGQVKTVLRSPVSGARSPEDLDELE